MKKASLLLCLLFVVSTACAHNKAVSEEHVQYDVAASTITVGAPPPPEAPVMMEAPSPAPVMEPAVVPAAQHESAGRFLQRIAYHTATRESLRVKRVDGAAPVSLPATVTSTAQKVVFVVKHPPITKKQVKTFGIGSGFAFLLIIVFGVLFEQRKI